MCGKGIKLLFQHSFQLVMELRKVKWKQKFLFYPNLLQQGETHSSCWWRCWRGQAGCGCCCYRDTPAWSSCPAWSAAPASSCSCSCLARSPPRRCPPPAPPSTSWHWSSASLQTGESSLLWHINFHSSSKVCSSIPIFQYKCKIILTRFHYDAKLSPKRGGVHQGTKIISILLNGLFH